MKPLRQEDYEDLARSHLPEGVFDYFAGGACDERTLRDNREAFDRVRLVGRVLRPGGSTSLASDVLGTEVSMPVMIAPVPLQRLAYDDGETATARAAAAAGTLMIVSALASTTIENIAAAGGGPLWFELFPYKDRDLARNLVRRAEETGCRALVLTVDAPVPGRCERDMKNRPVFPGAVAPANFAEAGSARLPSRTIGATQLAEQISGLMNPSADWNDLAWLVAETSLPVVVKGVLHPDDARLAVAHGAAGVFVSNHGGRQLDTATATLDALEGVVDAVEGRAEIYLDGGVRRGTDVVKALAMGAKAVAVGRPIVWGLAAAGTRGVLDVLQSLREELEVALALCGADSPDRIDRSLLF